MRGRFVGEYGTCNYSKRFSQIALALDLTLTIKDRRRRYDGDCN